MRLNGKCCTLGRRRAVPVLFVRGTHYDVGMDIGRTFKAMIHEFLSTYANLRQFEAALASPAGQDAYERTLNNMQKRFPHIIQEMRGIAAGAEVNFRKLFLLQMDDIIGTINDPPGPRPDAGGCSSIGVLNTNNFVLGHTEDAFNETLNHFYIVSAHIIPSHAHQERGVVEERFTSLCYAGHLPGYTMGFNAHGLVFSINTLSPRDLKPGHTPRTFLTRALLGASDMSDAQRILLDEGLGAANGFSVNMLWSGAGGRQLYNVEVAPDACANRSLVDALKYELQVLVHCNKYQRLKVVEVSGPIIDSSKARLARIGSHPPPCDCEDVRDTLSDTLGEQFHVFEDREDAVIMTIAAGVFDLEKMTWSIFIDKPNSTEPVAVLPIHFSETAKAPSLSTLQL